MRSNPLTFPSVTDTGLLSHERSHEKGEFVAVAVNLFAICEEKSKFQITFSEKFSATRAKKLRTTTGLFGLEKIAVFNELCCIKTTFLASV